MSKDILHVDLNNFYASVETLVNPDLKGRPVAVCGDPEKRHGIVLAKSTVAKACGVSTGEPIWKAKEKCRDLVVVPPHYREYTNISRKVFGLYTTFTPLVESFGLDECWLDVTGVKRLFGEPAEVAYKIKEAVKKETGGLTVSIGVSFSKVFAKLGSDLKKPDAISVIDRSNYRSIAWKLPVSNMLMVGGSTEKTLRKYGIYTIGDLAQTDKKVLSARFGKFGEKLWNFANGIDDDTVMQYDGGTVPQSVGNGTTTPQDITNRQDAASVIYALCEVIAFRLRKYGMTASGVSLNMRNVSLKSFSRQHKLDEPTAAATVISEAALQILDTFYDFQTQPPLRTITVTTYDLLSDTSIMHSMLFEESKEAKVEKSVDVLRNKYGYGILKRGINMGTVFNCDAREVDDDFIPFEKFSGKESVIP